MFLRGKALKTWMDSDIKEFPTYNPLIFADLQKMLLALHKLDINKPDTLIIYENLPVSVRQFINMDEWEKQITLALNKTKDRRNFQKRIYAWINGLKILQFIHFARDHFYPNVPVDLAASWILPKLGISTNNDYHLLDILITIRRYDREHPYSLTDFK